MASSLCQVYVCMYNNFLTTSFSLTSLIVVESLHKVYNTPLANVLLGLVYFKKFSSLTVQTKKFSLCQFFFGQVNVLKSQHDNLIEQVQLS